MNPANNNPPPDDDAFTNGNPTLPPSDTDLAANSRRRLRAETAFYLGLFSLTPALLIFQLWAILPVTALVGAALWTVYKLHRDRIYPFTLLAASWALVAISLCFLLLASPLAESEMLRPVIGVIDSVGLFGLLIFPLFALLALLYGIRNEILSVRQLVGMGAAGLHVVGLIAVLVVLVMTEQNR